MRKVLIILLLVLALTACKKQDSYDVNQVYNTVNNFIHAVQDNDYEQAKTYYQEDLDTLEFSNLVSQTDFGKAIQENETISYSVFGEIPNTDFIQITFIYNDNSHYFSVDKNTYKIIFNEGVILSD